MNYLKSIFVLTVSFSIIGCAVPEKAESNADVDQAQQTKKSLAEANRQIGMPAIKNYQERKLAKMIFELRDQENFVCHAYLVNKMNGKVGQYLGKCMGYGLPYSVQFTNPNKLVDAEKQIGIRLFEDSSRVQSLPQADPNGLFMPEGLSATWLMLLDKKGKPHPVYVEPEIIVSPFPLHDVKE